MANFIYLRLSTNEAKQKNSFDMQEVAIRERYPELAHEKYSVHKDTITGSATVDKRPALSSLLSALCSGDKVYILALDRLSRDSALSGWLRIEIRVRGAEIFSVRENLQDDPQGRLIATIIGAVAENEKDVIRSRVNSAISLKRSRGEKLGGQPPFGYEVEIINGVKFLKLNKSEQKVKLQIIAEYSKIRTYYGTAKSLIARGVSGRNGGVISPALIRNIILGVDK